MIAYLTRVVRFSSAHRYFRPEWSEDQNREAFGVCANPHGHGHNYVLQVTVAGAPDPLTGYAIDLGVLDTLIAQEVTSRLDHQHLNHAIPEFTEGALIPTTENLVIWIWKRLEGRIGDADLVQLRLIEDDSLWVDYFGEDERDDEGG